MGGHGWVATWLMALLEDTSRCMNPPFNPVHHAGLPPKKGSERWTKRQHFLTKIFGRRVHRLHSKRLRMSTSCRDLRCVDVWGSGGTDPYILNLGTKRGQWSVVRTGRTLVPNGYEAGSVPEAVWTLWRTEILSWQESNSRWTNRGTVTVLSEVRTTTILGTISGPNGGEY
jgi:hypothetical protein